MWTLAARIPRTIADATIGTVIVIAHIALAKRDVRRRRELEPHELPDGTRVWRSQISP
ncbi:MAG TPA: hypothetical protein VLB44_15080 [Kofleriaceae bacterium]|nr:hypothetical protein [Kofleriaceae bacterium]